MPIQLSDRDLQQLTALQGLLVSPLAHPDLPSWSQAVIHDLTHVLGTDRITMLVPGPSGLVHESHPVLEPFHGAIAGMVRPGPAGVAFRARQLDTAFRARRRRGWKVWSNRMLEEATGAPMAELDFYHEVVVPAGVAAGGGLTVELPEGEALIATGPGRWPDEGWLDLLRLLVPAFRAGAAAAATLTGQPSVVAALEHVSDGALVFDELARERYRNPAAAVLLAAPGTDGLRDEIQALARSLLTARRGRSSGGPVPPSRDTDVNGALYVLRGAHLPPGAFLRRPGVLVLVERRTPRLPTERTLVARFGLTEREAQVALLLARGLRNQDVVDRLDIRPSTVRTHAEHIFDKLGITSRKALALRLLGGEPTTP